MKEKFYALTFDEDAIIMLYPNWVSMLYHSRHKDKYSKAEISIARVVISVMTQYAVEKNDSEQTGSREDAVTIKLDYVAVANPTRERDAGNARLPAGSCDYIALNRLERHKGSSFSPPRFIIRRRVCEDRRNVIYSRSRTGRFKGAKTPLTNSWG